MLEARPHDLAESTGQISHSTCNILYDLNSQNNRNTHLYSQLTLTLLRGWWGRCEKNYLRKEEGREGGEKKRAQRARRTRGSNPGPAAC